MKKIKRRRFIKSSAAATLAFSSISVIGCSAKQNNKLISVNESHVLKGFDDEQEESPSLAANGNGEMWLFSLRRISYPDNLELISVFYFNGQNWIESDPLTASPGQFETPVASCALGGKPIVAWTDIKEGEWVIKTSQMDVNSFTEPYTFRGILGKSINPVLIAPNKQRNWIVWENLHNGNFSICISKLESGHWSDPITIGKENNSIFDPAMAEAKNGDLYLAYVVTQGFHQNIEMSILDGVTLSIKKIIPVAIGGGHKDRVNINSKPAIAFDAQDNLWISFENNRNTTRLEDGDNYTGDRCCAILSYQDGKIVEIEDRGKWLFYGENDHRPTFVSDSKGNLFLFTHCGGNFNDRNWRYRISWLDTELGWKEPETIFKTDVKGQLIPPAVVFDNNDNFWLSTVNEKFLEGDELKESDGATRSRSTELHLRHYTSPKLSESFSPIKFIETKVKEYAPDEQTIGTLSGHPRIDRKTKIIDGEKYTLVYGNLHEHSNSSNCWPAGTDGSLHDDYRFGMFSEGYDFFGMTDHAASTSEIHWRKNLRLADFYNESEAFVAMPAIEWTLQSDPEFDGIQHGAGHYNIIFASTEDAMKYIRNRYEIYSPRTPETTIAPGLWQMLRENEIQCVTIPHHTADKVHPLDWNVTDPKYVTTVEIFQCRGNNEYPGCPRERNLSRHTPTQYKHAYIDYALRAKKYKMGFIASGDHNSMGIGVAGLWVKELNRKGILEALQNRRTFATTGDKMFVDLSLNGVPMGSVSKSNKIPELIVYVVGQYPLEKVEILRNSKVIQTFDMEEDIFKFQEGFRDENFSDEIEILYYYVRAIQRNEAIAWSSPIWVERM